MQQQPQGTQDSQDEVGEASSRAAVDSTQSDGNAGLQPSPSAAEAAQRAADALFDTELAARMVQVASQVRGGALARK